MLHTAQPISIRLLVVGALLAAGCESSQTAVTSPSTVTRCALSVAAPDGQVPAQGGEGTVHVSASRDCTWSAASEASWLTITGARSGQGDGSVTFRAAGNADPASRRGAVVLNETRVEIVQAAAACEISLGEAGAIFGPGGGAGHVDVHASSGMCAWTAAAEAAWIQLGVREGRGSGRVTFEVQPTPGAGRSAQLTIAGQSFTITQSSPPSPGCTYQVEPLAVTLPAIGGAASVQITTSSACAWTAASAAPWISIAGASSGSGSGTVTLSASGSPGSARTGSAVVAGQQVTVSQLADVSPAPPAPPAPPPPAPPPPTPGLPPTCTYGMSPASASLPASGVSGSFALETGSTCTWTASSPDAWITLLNPTGTGPGPVRFQVPANPGAPRTGTILAGGRTFTLQQAGGCGYTLSATTRTVPATGGSATVEVTTGGSCSWTGVSRESWITVVDGATGQGNGTVRFSAAANTGSERTGVIDIAGQPVTVVQAGACTFAINPSQQSIGASGGQLTVAVAGTAGCAWTASTATPWIQVSQGASGSGTGEVRLTVAPNAGTEARTGTVTIAGRSFSVTQAGAAPPPNCDAEVTPTSVNAPAAGGNIQLRVTIGASCSWQSAPNVPWIRITAGTQSSGNGPVLLQIEGNTGPARTGSVTVAGVTVPVIQQGQ